MQKLIIAFALSLLVVRPAHALTDEQRAELVDHFGKLKDLQDFSSGAVNAALADEDFKGFFDGYSKVITVVQIADKLADAKDLEALQLVGGEGAKAALSYMAKQVPALGGAVGAVSFISWANTGLQLFKDFAFDPYLEKAQFETYAKLRGALDPEMAAAKTFGWGFMREKALKQLAKQGYNMDLLWENGEKGKLSQVWEHKLEQWVVASFEAKYERKLIQDAAKAGKKELPGLDHKALAALDKHKHDEGSSEEGAFAGEIRSVTGNKLEVFVNGKAVVRSGNKANTFRLDKSNRFTVRVAVVGAKRQQSRDLNAKHPANVTLDGKPTDWAYAYSAGDNASSWRVTDEHYDWKIATRTPKPLDQQKSSSGHGIKDDVVTFTVAPDTASETITLDVSGDVKWEMTGKRANRAKATDQSDETETGSIVIGVSPAK